LRVVELFNSDDAITFDEFYTYKYDDRYSDGSQMVDIVQAIVSATFPQNDTNLQQAQQMVREWDLRMQPESRAASLATFTVYYLMQDGLVSPSRLVGPQLDPKAVQDAFVRAVGYLKDKFGRVDVAWEQVNRLIRGSLDVGLGGGPDVLHAIYGELQADGRFKGFQGDCYVMLVRWDVQGEATSFSIHQYGSATLDVASPHYADQALLFAVSQLKPVWMDEAEIRLHLEQEYQPGD